MFIRTSVSGFNVTEIISFYRKIRIKNWRCTDWLTSNPQRKESWLTEQKLSVINLSDLLLKLLSKVEVAVVNKDKETAVNALGAATAIINKAASKGVYHKNNAARKVSRLAKAVNSLN